MPINCQFNLSRSSRVYYTGEQISGTLLLSVAKKKPLQLEGECESHLSNGFVVVVVAGLIRYRGTVTNTTNSSLLLSTGISIALIGLSQTNWQETDRSCRQIEHNDSTGRTESVQIQFEGNKTHIEQTEQLAESLILPQGITQLGSFEFQLPDSLPGSCRLPHGSVDYTLQVSLERRGKCVKRFQHRLIVRNHIEFGELRPAQCESSTCSLRLPRSVFVPGQRVGYQVETTCMSSGPLVTRLCQCITYVSQQPVAKVKKVLRVLDESCELEGALHLPLTAPIARQMQGEPIEITYHLETLSSDATEPLRLPLLVGTVAPPVDSSCVQQAASCPSLGFVNLGKCRPVQHLHLVISISNSTAALCENELLFSTISQLLQPHSCSREIKVSSFAPAKHSEHLKLLRHQKKQSYVRLALRFFYKRLLPAN